MSGPAWTIEKVTVTDVLGFQGTSEFEFGPGMQVIEAPNHSGKTSLTLAVLWCLTGEIPKLPRLHLGSFRLTNKHRGDNAEPRVAVALSAQGGERRMVVDRRYSSSRKANPDDMLSVEQDGQTLTGTDAEEMIQTALALKPASLQGCGVVLQDHRLKLITGSTKEIGDVINDMLGLYALSQLAPVLDEQHKEIKSLGKRIAEHLESADPLARWEERQKQLADELANLENQALAAGFASEDLEAPKATAKAVLERVATDLGASVDLGGLDPTAQVDLLRGELASLRKQSPQGRELAQLLAGQERLAAIASQGEQLSDHLGDHIEALAREAAEGEMNVKALAAQIAACDAQLKTNEKRREELAGEERLAQAAYQHLLSHQDLTQCPVCDSAIEMSDLLARTRERLNVAIADELQQLGADDEVTEERRNSADLRLSHVQDLQDEHRQVLQKVTDLAGRLEAHGTRLAALARAEDLFSDGTRQQELASELTAALRKVERDRADLEQQEKDKLEAQARVEESKYQPAEQQVNLVRDHLVQVIDAQAKLEAHGNLRDKAASDKNALEKLHREVREFASRLNKISKALTSHEQAAATAAINEQMPVISRVFTRIAQNPDYDGLQVKTSITRDKIQYQLQATSSQVGSLDDVVQHVLSEGDLSAAGVALLVGLAMGKTHNLGFLILDDPAQGMDPNLQTNFATELASMDKLGQVIILTHQPSFAEALERAGASKTVWGGWKGGRLAHA